MTLASWRHERLTAVRAVRDAAAVCRAVRAALGPELAATKADRSPVTVADYASQALISLALAEAFPDDAIVGEESSGGLTADVPAELVRAVVAQVRSIRPEVDLESICWALDRCGEPGGPAGRHWALDPVDGTKGFLRNQQYAVALALIEDGVVRLGVLACPNLSAAASAAGAPIGTLFVAESGRGAQQLGLAADAPGRPVQVSRASGFRGARYTESFEAGHSSQGVASAIATRLGITAAPLRMDSQAKYGLVARGEVELYLRLPHGDYVEQVWDHAAGSLIVEEAGGRVSDFTGAPLDFTTGRRLERNRGVVAAPAALHAQAAAAARRVMEG